MPDDLWRTDIYAWSQRQADRLRRLRAGERPNDLDWDNVIEEIESVGRSQVDAVESLLGQAALHLMKRRAWPNHAARNKWRTEAAEFLLQAQEKYRPSMAQALDLDRVHRYALRRLRVQSIATPPEPVLGTGRIPLEAAARDGFTLEELEAALFPPA